MVIIEMDMNMTAAVDALKLDRNLTNTSFASWRLGAEAVQHKRVIQLPHAAFDLRSDSIDFLHTRSSVLHNSLCVSQGRIFTFLEGDGSSLLLSEIKDYYDTQKCSVEVLSIISQATDQLVGPVLEQALEPSISVITPSQHEDQYQALVSSGNGDLRLLTPSGDGTAASTASDPVFPLRPNAPLTGRRPFHLEQAYHTPAGSICCIAWAVRSSSPGKVACAEVYAISLSTKHEPGMQPQLSMDDVLLLRRCALPPYAALCDPSTSRVLLAVDPTTIDDEVEHVECRPEQQPGTARHTDDGGEHPAVCVMTSFASCTCSLQVMTRLNGRRACTLSPCRVHHMHSYRSASRRAHASIVSVPDRPDRPVHAAVHARALQHRPVPTPSSSHAL
jgi:hypothetical protein